MYFKVLFTIFWLPYFGNKITINILNLITFSHKIQIEIDNNTTERSE